MFQWIESPVESDRLAIYQVSNLCLMSILSRPLTPLPPHFRKIMLQMLLKTSTSKICNIIFFYWKHFQGSLIEARLVLLNTIVNTSSARDLYTQAQKQFQHVKKKKNTCSKYLHHCNVRPMLLLRNMKMWQMRPLERVSTLSPKRVHHLNHWSYWRYIGQNIPSEMGVVPCYTLLTLFTRFTLFIVFKLLYTN